MELLCRVYEELSSAINDSSSVKYNESSFRKNNFMKIFKLLVFPVKLLSAMNIWGNFR